MREYGHWGGVGHVRGLPERVRSRGHVAADGRERQGDGGATAAKGLGRSGSVRCVREPRVRLRGQGRAATPGGGERERVAGTWTWGAAATRGFGRRESVRCVRERGVRLGSRGHAAARGGRGREGGTRTRERRVRDGAARRRRRGVRFVRKRGVRCVRERGGCAGCQATREPRGRRRRDLAMGRGLGAGMWRGEDCVRGRDPPTHLARRPWCGDLG